ncbi:MAG: T9SS type A sorting domain-containing protein [Bacteroidota bacterium]
MNQLLRNLSLFGLGVWTIVCTANAQPIVTTFGAGNITATTAKLNATVEDDNISDVSAIVFRYGTSTGVYTNTIVSTPATLSAGDGSTEVTANLTGLAPSTTYFFVIEATDDLSQTVIGSELTFRTTGNTSARTPGLLLNEIGNLSGNCCVPSGNEFIELLVLGDESNPTANVDLSGWVIDDNNTDFSNGNPEEGSVGFSTGHLRLSSACFSSIPPGSLITIYNDGGTCIAPPGVTDDETDINGDGIYVFPVSSTCIEVNEDYPCNGGGCGDAYSMYDLGTYSTTSSCKFATIGLRNSGDVVQVRRPDFSFFHGYSFGSINGGSSGTNFPSYPNGNLAFRGATGSDVGLTGCSNATVSSGVTASGGSETPAAANNPDNLVVIELLALGTLVYEELVGSGSSTNCTSFPVEWLSFEGEIQQNKALITWETTNEINNLGFDIQRQTATNDYESIGFVPAGTGKQTYRYAFVDETPSYGVNTYRLKQKDIDGQHTYSSTLTLNFEPQDVLTLIQVFPNPVKNQLHVRMQSPLSSEGRFEVYGLDGRKVQMEGVSVAAGIHELTFDTSHLPQGVYHFVLTAQGTRVRGHFVKE